MWVWVLSDDNNPGLCALLHSPIRVVSAYPLNNCHRYSRLRSDSASGPSASAQRAVSNLSVASAGGASGISASSFRVSKQAANMQRPKTAIGFGSAGVRGSGVERITLARYASQEDLRRTAESTQQAKEKRIDETCAMAAHRANEAGLIALGIIDAFMADFQVRYARGEKRL